jgi:hypothetical protein
MTTKTKIPPLTKFGMILMGLVANLGVFLIGFWHTHLGVKGYWILESEEAGSFVLAGITLAVLLLMYVWATKSGSKIAFLSYLIVLCVIVMSNLNNFYPNNLGRKLVTEEAIELNDTLQSYANIPLASTTEQDFFKDFRNLGNLKGQIISEVKQVIYGPRAQSLLDAFNAILKKYHVTEVAKPSFAGVSKEQQVEILEPLLVKSIEDFQMENVNVKDVENYLKGKEQLTGLKEKYTPILKAIIEDDSHISSKEVKHHPQITQLQALITEINNATKTINGASHKNEFPEQGLGREAKTRNLFQIPHTLSSIKERINKLDTWIVIGLCLFIDLIVPLVIYFCIRFFIRRREDEEQTGIFNFRKNKKNQPENFNYN